MSASADGPFSGDEHERSLTRLVVGELETILGDLLERREQPRVRVSNIVNFRRASNEAYAMANSSAQTGRQLRVELSLARVEMLNLEEPVPRLVLEQLILRGHSLIHSIAVTPLDHSALGQEAASEFSRAQVAFVRASNDNRPQLARYHPEDQIKFIGLMTVYQVARLAYLLRFIRTRVGSGQRSVGRAGASDGFPLSMRTARRYDL